jgi:serine O-acetyltransferase
LHDVPSNSTVVGIPGRVVRRKASDLDNALAHQNLPDPTMEALADLARRVERLESGRKAPRSKARRPKAPKR